MNEAVKKHTGSNIHVDWERTSGGWWPFGYIDHQSFEYDVPDVLESIWSEDEKEFKKKYD